MKASTRKKLTPRQLELTRLQGLNTQFEIDDILCPPWGDAGATTKTLLDDALNDNASAKFHRVRISTLDLKAWAAKKNDVHFKVQLPTAVKIIDTYLLEKFGKESGLAAGGCSKEFLIKYYLGGISSDDRLNLFQDFTRWSGLDEASRS
jgi:hypothetical protein